MKRLFIILGTLALLAMTGCTTANRVINPYYEPPSKIALKGNANDHALAGGHGKIAGARKALDAMASYQRTQTPTPYKPVMNPAIVRLMWVPDHLNKYGDLIPAHYYYLKVKKEDFAVTDAYELEEQLSPPRGRDSRIPFVHKN